jgi:hypothetical protein
MREGAVLCDTDGDVAGLRDRCVSTSGVSYALVNAWTEDGSKHRSLLYPANAGGRWRLETIADGRSNGSAENGWFTSGTPELLTGRVCAGTSGSAIVFSQHLGHRRLLAVATLASSGVDVRNYDLPVTFAPDFGTEGRGVDCAANGDKIHIAYESGTAGDLVAQTVFDVATRKFTRPATLAMVGNVGFRLAPRIRIDGRRNRVHLIGLAHEDSSPTSTILTYHASGPINGALSMIERTPIAGVAREYRMWRSTVVVRSTSQDRWPHGPDRLRAEVPLSTSALASLRS